MKWQTVAEKLAKFIDLMTGNIDIGCTACPAKDHCDHRDCYRYITRVPLHSCRG